MARLGVARVIVGLKTTKQELYETIDVAGCDHNDGTNLFCPQCGAARLKKITQPRHFVRIDVDGLHIGQYNVFGEEGDKEFIVQMYPSKYTDEAMPDDSELIHITYKFTSDFDNFISSMLGVGLWNPSRFGAWPSYSY